MKDDEPQTSGDHMRRSMSQFSKAVAELGLADKSFDDVLNLMGRPATVGEVARLHLFISDFQMTLLEHLTSIAEGKPANISPLLDVNRKHATVNYDLMLSALPDRNSSKSETDKALNEEQS